MEHKTLYIIHGWTYSIDPWTSVVSILKTKGVDVRQLRVPGLTSPSDAVWTIGGYVQWLHGELKGETSPVILGHSNGGRIALNYLDNYPGSFDKLILLNSAGVNVNNEKVSIKRKLFRLGALILRPLRYVPVARKIAYRLIGGSDYERAPTNMKQTLQNMLESDASLTLPTIETPTIVLWGKEDRITPTSQGRKIAYDLPRSVLHEFEDWGHAPYITHPNQLAEAIIDALEEKV